MRARSIINYTDRSDPVHRRGAKNAEKKEEKKEEKKRGEREKGKRRRLL
jgi:hypothetical protein